MRVRVRVRVYLVDPLLMGSVEALVALVRVVDGQPAHL